MAGAIKKLSFASRQADIALCRVVNLKFAEGDLRAEYVPASELNNDGTWEYQFLVQEEDLPGALTLDDVKNCNIIEPYWACVDAESEEEDACQLRAIRCFDDIPIITELGETDYVAIMRHNVECDTWCLNMMAPYTFVELAPATDGGG